LHGALLDAELLAEVYINMTRGQNSLMIDMESPAQRSGPALASDFSGLDLPVLWATPHEHRRPRNHPHRARQSQRRTKPSSAPISYTRGLFLNRIQGD
jgi:DNA polymerase III epsilon subunit-like protein